MAKIECTEQVHAMLKQYCKEHRLFIKDFVSALVLRELAPVEVKSVATNRMPTAEPDDPWTKPPFWEE